LREWSSLSTERKSVRKEGCPFKSGLISPLDSLIQLLLINDGIPIQS
jgi:hypothetical protein